MSIQLSGVGKSYRNSFSRKPVPAVQELTLTIDRGEIFGIIGPNGAGKSTLLKMLMGFIRPSCGTITILGGPPGNSEVKRRIGYLPENPYYYDHLSAEELMRFSARTCGMGREETDRKIDELLKTLSLDHARQRKLRSYSKGMTQRAGICFALVHDPELVILDEPMSGLDPMGRRDVVDLVLNLKARGKTVLFCSHILNDVERLCDRMAIMNRGRLLEVMTKERLSEYSSQMVLNCPKLPSALKTELQALGTDVKEEGGGDHVVCRAGQAADVLQCLGARGIEILNVEAKTTALENIFFDIIRNGSES